VRDSEPAGVSVAIIRTVVEPGPRPVIRILQISDLFENEHLLAVTTSVDEAARVIGDWLRDVIARRSAPS
jgi:hypothetical protein